MNYSIALILALTVFGCHMQQDKAAPVSQVQLPRANARVEGPEVELVKRMFSSFSAGQFDSMRNCFTDDALIYSNVWLPDTSYKGAPVGPVLAAEEKEMATVFADTRISDPIIDVVTYPDGSTYAHSISRFTGKIRKSGKAFDVPLAHKFKICGGKICEEWLIYDSGPFLP